MVTFQTLFIWALIDSGATGIFINKTFVTKHYFNIHELSSLVSVYNVDSIPNKAG